MYKSNMSRKYAPNQIRRLRKERGMTIEALAAAMDPEPSFATVQKLETSTMGLTHEYMISIATALDVQPYELIMQSAPGVRVVPILGAISAGKWGDAVEIADEFVAIPDSAGGPRSFALRPFGDSMNLIVDESGLAVCDPDQIDLIDGRSYALLNGSGEATFKKFGASPPRLDPCSTNPAHTSIPLGREPFTVIGRITFALNPM